MNIILISIFDGNSLIMSILPSSYNTFLENKDMESFEVFEKDCKDLYKMFELEPSEYIYTLSLAIAYNYISGVTDSQYTTEKLSHMGINELVSDRHTIFNTIYSNNLNIVDSIDVPIE